MREVIAGIDLGGTNVRIAISDKGTPEKFLTHLNCKTPADEGPAAFLEIVDKGIWDCLNRMGLDRSSLVGIGCTIPGITDAPRGVSLFVSNLTGWDGYPICSKLEERFKTPAAVDNDVNAAALGEYWYGQGKGAQSIIYLTVSTGIAAGIVIEGKLLRGFNHAAGEIGFFMPDPRLLDRNWEPNGCLELTSAGVGLVQSWKKENPGVAADISAKDVFNAAEKGDEAAMQVVKYATDYLSQAAIAIATVIDPERIIMSGSVVQHQPQVFRRISEMVNKHIMHPPDISLSTFEGDAPLIGALALIAKYLD